MSEYIEIEPEIDDDDPAVIHFYTNLPLTGDEVEVEEYAGPAAMAVGSALAQALAAVDGLLNLRLAGQEMTIRRTWDAPEHAIVADIVAVLKDFFL